jgi:protein SCO1/2
MKPRGLLCITILVWLVTAPFAEGVEDNRYDDDTALEVSQGALGNLVRNQRFVTPDGGEGRIDQFRGKPLVLSLVYTSCNHICPMTTRNLARAVMKAREALATDAFNVVTLGFDSRFDTPDRMGFFASLQEVGDSHWYMASMDETAVNELSEDVGFLFHRAAGGFEHLVQTTIIDANGRVYRQVYGQSFNTPLLVDPLISLVLGESDSGAGFFTTLKDKVRLFCTTYDPVRDGYYYDYSLFVGIFIGAVIILLTGVFLLREVRGR